MEDLFEYCPHCGEPGVDLDWDKSCPACGGAFEN